MTLWTAADAIHTPISGIVINDDSEYHPIMYKIFLGRLNFLVLAS